MGGELFSLFAKLTLDTSEFDQNTDRAKEKASVFGDVLAADLVGKGISLAFDGLKKLGGAIKDFTTDAVMSYGEIEQLRGGIETLFGEAAPKVLADADQAFKTAGMSASQYMDTSIQSAAALINSLGGNQERAAKMMNMSITDMADNVNKMGTSMEAVQNAYRGFSRGNFTMLDNLALGFSGTKEGMQELIDKANEIRQNKDLDLRDLTINSYADIVQAIHEVQDEMGITGTTSREAAETIQGSLGSMKSAWENLVAGIADPDANLGERITAFADSAEVALNIIVPAVGRTLSGVGVVIKRLAPVVLEKIPEIFNDLAPDLGEAALAMIEYVMDAFTEQGGKLLEAGIEWVTQLSDGLVEGIPKMLEVVLPLVENFSEFVREGAGKLFDVGIDFILNLAQGIMDSLPMLIEQVPQIIINFAGAINDNAPKLLVGGVQLIWTIVQGIISAIPTLIDNIPKIFEAFLAVWTALNWVNLGKNVIEFIRNGIEQLSNNLPQALKDIGNKAIEWFKGVDWAHAGTQAINFIKSAILGMATAVPTTLLNIGKQAWNWFKSVDWYSLGSNIIDGIVQGLKDGVRWITDAAKSVAQKAKDAAENLLGIASPSKVFRYEIGQMIPKGLALGIDDAAIDAINSAEELSKKVFKPFDDLNAPVVSVTAENGTMGAFSQDFGTIMAEYIRTNNDALAEAFYTAFMAVMRDGGFVMQMDGREVGRWLRENGVAMA